MFLLKCFFFSGLYSVFSSFDVSQVEPDKRREEQREFGVFFDDDYNYLQHLKEAAPTAELVADEPAHGNRPTLRLRGDDDDDDEEDRDVLVSRLLS